MNPEDLFDPEALPDDLRWVIAQYNLQPDDPVFLLIGWHWTRVQQAEDTLRALTLELKVVLDARVEAITEAADRIDSLDEKLKAFESALVTKSAHTESQGQPDSLLRLGTAVETARVLEESMTALLRSARAALTIAHRRQVIAGLAAGIAFGITVAVLFLFQ